MSDLDYNALGQAIDTTWGKSSSPIVNSFSVKMSLIGPDMLRVSYQTIVNFASERQMLQVKIKEQELSSGNIKTVLDAVKNSYKDLTSKTLKLKEVSSGDSVEIIGMAVHNPKKTAIYRKNVMFEVG
jgi:hypothetical protein